MSSVNTHRINGSSPAHSWFGTQWLILIPVPQEKLLGQRFSSTEGFIDALKKYDMEISPAEWKYVMTNGSNACESV